MNVSVLLDKIRKKLLKLRLQPIEVFVFHAVTEEFDESLNQKEDWTSTAVFKNHIEQLSKHYTFISLEDANHHIHSDIFRRKRFAVMTCDDGFRSVLDILPFFEEQHIPLTLFINTKYLDGTTKRKGYASNPQYITKEELDKLTSPLISIGMHGHEHYDASKMTQHEFASTVDLCASALVQHPRYIPYFAYTWGNSSEITQRVLKEKDIVPVFTDGESNYHDKDGISRRAIDNYYWKKVIKIIHG